MKIHDKYDILISDEISNLDAIETRIANRVATRNQEMANMPHKKREELWMRRMEWEKEQWVRDQERANMPKPPTLFRVFKEKGGTDEVLNNHLLGTLWFQSPRRFRKIEGAQADFLEGLGSYEKSCGGISQDISDSTPIDPAFILCFGEQAESLQDLGEDYLEVQDPWELKRRVERSLPDGSQVKWIKIKYDKEWKVKVDLNPSQQWFRKHCSKPKKYADEKEWRLVIFLAPPLQLLNETLKVNVGNLQDVFRYRGHYKKQ